jgi:tetratricopeptide (TPR) repeat protein
MRHGWWDFSAWGERAEIEFDMKDFKSAIQSSNRAIYYHCDRYRATKSPDHFVEMLQYLKLRGNASQFLGDFPSTIRDWEWMIAAIEQAADAGDASRWKDLYASVLNNLSLAYGRSRSPEHGPRRGIQLATRANNLTQGGHPEILDTLAELHARLGDFPAAIRHEEEAIKLLDAKHQDAGRGEQFRLRLDRYRKGCLPPEG